MTQIRKFLASSAPSLTRTAFRMSSAAASSIEDPVQRALMAERCLLVDKDDKVIGEASKEDCHLLDPVTGTSPLHRAFSAFVFNDRGELLLQRRSKHKVTFPGLWSNTCCSHPLATLDERDGSLGAKRAARRKLGHELGIPEGQCDIQDMAFLGRILYAAPCSQKWGEHELDYILFLRKKGPDSLTVSPNPNEVSATRFLPRSQLSALFSDPSVSLTPWFSLVARDPSMLPRWWDAMEEGRLEEVSIKEGEDLGKIVDLR